MAGTRRKDNKGRVLRKGEGQRKDNTDDYRYIDVFGKRRSVYAATLKELREKEAEVEKANNARLDYASGNCTVLELVERYTKLKLGVRYNTKVGYAFVTNILKNDEFGRRKIRDIRVSDVQLWLAQLRKIEMIEQGTTPFFTPNTTPKWRKSGVEIRRDMKTG